LGTNRVEIAGVLEAPEPMRMTPAGVPTLRFSLRHQSTQMEAGHPRTVECALRVVVVGPVAEQVRGLAAESELVVTGFLSRASHRNDWPVLHATAVTVI
jgi:primosomal replication protein N